MCLNPGSPISNVSVYFYPVFYSHMYIVVIFVIIIVLLFNKKVRINRLQMTLKQILQPAIDLAENGFPVHHIAAFCWNKGT